MPLPSTSYNKEDGAIQTLQLMALVMVPLDIECQEGCSTFFKMRTMTNLKVREGRHYKTRRSARHCLTNCQQIPSNPASLKHKCYRKMQLDTLICLHQQKGVAAALRSFDQSAVIDVGKGGMFYYIFVNYRVTKMYECLS